MNEYICKHCGYNVEGEEIPEKCPVCDSPKSIFEVVKANEEK